MTWTSFNSQKCGEDFKTYWAQALQRAHYTCNHIFPFRGLRGWRVRCTEVCLLNPSVYSFIAGMIRQHDSVNFLYLKNSAAQTTRFCFVLWRGDWIIPALFLWACHSWKHGSMLTVLLLPCARTRWKNTWFFWFTCKSNGIKHQQSEIKQKNNQFQTHSTINDFVFLFSTGKNNNFNHIYLNLLFPPL